MLSQKMSEKLQYAIDHRIEVALVTVTKHADEQYLGRKVIVWPDGEFFSDQEDQGFFVREIVKQSLPLLQAHTTKAITFTWNSASVECFVEVLAAPSHLIVAGAGHIAEPVVKIGTMLGFYVTVIDDRPAFARQEKFPDAAEVMCQPFLDYFRSVSLTEKTYILLITRGHQFDVMSLRELLQRRERPAYIGMIGSQRRIAGVFTQLKEDFPEESFGAIYSPVGLELGAQTPAEIAVSIMAEILKLKNGGTGRPLHESLKRYAKTRFTERV